MTLLHRSFKSKEREEEKDKILVCGSDRNGGQVYGIYRYMLASFQDSASKDQTFLI